MFFAPLWIRFRKKLVVTMATMGLTLAFFFGVSLAFAQGLTPATPTIPAGTVIGGGDLPQVTCESLTMEEGCLAEDDLDCEWTEETGCLPTPEEPPSLDLEEPSQKALLRIQEPDADSNWKADTLQTLGLKFLVRGKEALAWTLNIDDPGFHNDAIQSSHVKVLTIVNSLFILGLLVIAAMWMFSILIPRPTLRRVVLIFAGAVIFVNFALPINQLFIDSTNLLQKTFLTDSEGAIEILDMVETPAYLDVMGYEDEGGIIEQNSEHDVQIQLSDDETLTDVPVGRVTGDPLSNPLTISGDLSGGAGGNINLEIPAGGEQILTMNREQKLTISSTENFKPHQEQAIFAFILMLLTGLGYFALALIFILRIVILWALLIVSPILFLLAIFETTRGWFFSWLSLYGRWLLVGPLAALGVSVVVGIWQSIGLPIESSYTGAGFTGVTNALFYLPGSTTPNTLSTTGEMMQYLVFLMMLYLPIFFAFALTRRSMWRSALTVVTERLRGRGKERITPTPSVTETKESKTTEIKEEKRSGWVDNMKELVSTQISKFTETAMPATLRTSKTTAAVPSASSFLPEQLKLTGIHDMLGLIGVTKESRKSRDNAITQLAMPSRIEDRKEREHVSAIRSEIERRSSANDPEAMLLMNEIHSREATLQEKETVTERTVEHSGEVPSVTVEAKPEIHVEAKLSPEETPKTETIKTSDKTMKTEPIASEDETDENEEEDKKDEADEPGQSPAPSEDDKNKDEDENLKT